MKDFMVWLKIGEHLVQKKDIHAVARQGEGTVISRTKGDDLIVDLPYEKVKKFID